MGVGGGVTGVRVGVGVSVGIGVRVGVGIGVRVASGVSVGVGVSVRVGVGVGVGVGAIREGDMGIAPIPPICTGLGKYILGWPRRAPFIKAVHTLAGKVPPVTEFNPPIPLRDCEAFSLKKATEAASWGVYPLNQAEAFCSLVPVLPAAGRPKPAVPYAAVPRWTTSLSAYVKSAMTSLAKTSWPWGLA